MYYVITNQVEEDKKMSRKDKTKLDVFEKVTLEFTTVDGAKHFTRPYNWCKVSSINCTVEEYIMIDARDDGYLIDDKGILYPLSNILSITKSCVELYTKESDYNNFKLWYDEKDLKPEIKTQVFDLTYFDPNNDVIKLYQSGKFKVTSVTTEYNSVRYNSDVVIHLDLEKI